MSKANISFAVTRRRFLRLHSPGGRGLLSFAG
jgi:hypothetical protein